MGEEGYHGGYCGAGGCYRVPADLLLMSTWWCGGCALALSHIPVLFGKEAQRLCREETGQVQLMQLGDQNQHQEWGILAPEAEFNLNMNLGTKTVGQITEHIKPLSFCLTFNHLGPVRCIWATSTEVPWVSQASQHNLNFRMVIQTKRMRHIEKLLGSLVHKKPAS